MTGSRPLPLVLLRRLDCVLGPTKAQVLARAKALAGRGKRGRDRTGGPRGSLEAEGRDEEIAAAARTDSNAFALLYRRHHLGDFRDWLIAALGSS